MTMKTANANFHLHVAQSLEIENILADWKRTLPVKEAVKRQAKVLELLRALDKKP